MKKMIPNVLTLSRLLVIPLIIYLGIYDHTYSLLILAFFIALTDFLDGKLARKWDVASELGAKLDAIGDKCLALSLLIILIFNYHGFFYIFILECLIALFNIYTYYKTKTVESLLIGKIKTWVIFITILLGLLDIILTKIHIPIKLFIFLTVLFQIGSLIDYMNNYALNKNKKKSPTFKKSEYYKIIKEILENEEFLKRKNYAHHYNESVYDHVLRVSYDAYKIGKKLHLDYKALAIAGLLHDFYDKPWQETFDKSPFFKKHAFVHAEQARINALKYFPNLMTKKIESMITTHMFPINKKIPKYKESWILTIVDKADSLDFLFHPLLMIPKIRKKKRNKREEIKIYKEIK